MCDRISQIVAAAAPTTRESMREGRHPRAGETVGGVLGAAVTPAYDTPAVRTIQKKVVPPCFRPADSNQWFKDESFFGSS